MLEIYSVTSVLQFYRLLIGYYSFKNGLEYTKDKKKDNAKFFIGNIKISNKKEFLSFSIGKKKAEFDIVYCLNSNTKELKIFEGLDALNSVLKLENYELKFFELLLVENHEKKYLDSGNFIYESFYRASLLSRPKYYQFIIGTGVSLDYGAATWPKLVKSIKDKIDSYAFFKNSQDVNDGIFNTTYGYPMILKDLSINDYYDVIHSKIYSRPFATVSGSVLESVAKYLGNYFDYNAPYKLKALTFNYDDFLEEEIQRNCAETYICRYYNGYQSKIEQIKVPVVLHLHGYLDQNKSIITSAMKKSIVLTDEDYFDGYKSTRSFCYKNLYKFLEDTCLFIGNSISDYEEQKTIKKHFEISGFTSYHFALFKKSGDISFDAYKTIFFLKMGIICLWFDDFSDIANYVDYLPRGFKE